MKLTIAVNGLAYLCQLAMAAQVEMTISIFPAQRITAQVASDDEKANKVGRC